MTDDVRPKWIDIIHTGKSPSGKTGRWTVKSRDNGLLLGRVEWYGPWRKYVFCPNEMTVFEQACLRDIAGFVERQTKEHKAGLTLPVPT